MSKVIRWAISAGVLLALLVPLAATAHGDSVGKGKDRRVLYATDSAGNLLSFRASSPDRVQRKMITGCRQASRSGASTFAPPRATCTGSAATRSCTG